VGQPLYSDGGEVGAYIGEELRGISDNWSSNRGMYMQTNFGYGALLCSTPKIGVIK